MKIKFIAAAAIACCAQAAFADAGYTAAVTKINQAVASGKVLRMTGASAMAGSIRAAVAKTCAGNKIDAWFIAGTQTTSALGNYNLYVCTAKDLATTNFASNPHFTAGANNAQVVIVSHEGSATSLQGANGGIPLAMLQTSLASCNATSIGNLTVQGVSVPVYNGCATAPQTTSIGGFSDVEKALFKNVVDGGGLVLNNDASIEVTPSFGGQVFGVAVSRPLYRALQAAQGITSADCTNDTIATQNANGTGTVTVVGSNDMTTPACQPSITKQQYATLVSAVNTETFGLAENAWASFGLTGAAAKNVRLARRVDLSGTQAASNAYFLNLNCAASGAQDPATVAGSNGKLTVTAETGTSGVIAKLNSGEGTGTKGTANDYVIGVISAENAVRATDSFGYLKINGVSPTEDSFNRQSAIDGRYDFAYEFVLHSNANDTSVAKDYMKLLNDLIGGDPADADSPNLAGIYTLPFGFANADFPSRVSKGAKGGNSCAPSLNVL